MLICKIVGTKYKRSYASIINAFTRIDTVKRANRAILNAIAVEIKSIMIVIITNT